MHQSRTTVTPTGDANNIVDSFPWLNKAMAAMRSSLFAIYRGLSSTIRLLRATLPNAAPDSDVISSQLDVENRGQVDGRNEQPCSTQETLTGYQGEIVAHFKELRRTAHRQRTVSADKLRGAREKIDLNQSEDQIRRIADACQKSLFRLHSNFRSRLQILAEREEKAEHHYLAFRKNNELVRAAERVGPRYVYLALMAFLIGCVTVALGRIGGPISPEGYVISPWLAALFSLMAVLMPFVIGSTLLKSINHRDELRRLGGWLIAAATTAFLGGLAFFVGRYTQARLADPDATIRGVADAIMLDPAVIGNAAPIWMGVGTVAIAGTLALLLGYKSDDPYPGYGSTQREFYRARKDREALVKRLRKRVNRIIDRATADVATIMQRSKSNFRRYVKLVDDADRALTRLSLHELALEETCNIVLDRYRTANVNARVSPTPASFSKHVTLDDGEDNRSVPTGDEDQKLEELRREMSDLEETVGQIRQQFADINWQELVALEGVESSDFDESDERDGPAVSQARRLA